MPIMNSTQHSSIYGWTGSSWERVELNSNNQLEVEIKNTDPLDVSGSFSADISGQSVVVSNNSDPATATKQDAQTSLLTSIDTSITTCDTGNVSGSVSVSNNTDPATATKQDAQTSLLTSIDGSITTCDTGNVSGSVSVSNNTDPATATLQTAGNASLTELEGSLYADGDAIGVSDKGVLIMGRNGTNSAKPIHITNNGDIEVEIADFVKGQDTSANSFPVVLASDSVVSTQITSMVNKGSFGNIANNTTLTAGSQSGVADISEMNSVNVLYSDTATSSFDALAVLVSGDGTNYDVLTELFPTNNSAGTLRFANFESSLGGLTHLKIENISTTDSYTNVKASVFGSPN